MSIEEIANAFVQHYYTSFDSNVEQLAGLFSPQSMMTFEGQQFQGTDNIMNKLRGIGIVKHNVKSTDIQPSTDATNAIIIFVTGSISISNDNPLHYCEMFQLVSTAPGQFYVHNCVFRLNYGL